MKRAIAVWLIYATCVVGITVFMGWLSLRAVKSVHDEQRRELTATSERLALWRLDSALMPLIIQESARHHMLYVGDGLPTLRHSSLDMGNDPGAEHPPERATAPGQSGALQEALPSAYPNPQLENSAPFVNPQGGSTAQSPTLPPFPGENSESDLRPPAPQQSLAMDEQQFQVNALNFVLPSVTPPSRIAESVTPFVQLYFSSCDTGMTLTSSPVNPSNSDSVSQLWSDLSGTVTNDDFLRQLPSSDEDTVEVVALIDIPSRAEVPSKAGQFYQGKGSRGSEVDRNQRQQNVGNSVRQYVEQNAFDNRVPLPSHVQMGPLSSFWKGDLLILARRLNVQGEEQVQGCLLDWRRIRPWLVAQVADILPEASLMPAIGIEEGDGDRVLASLPILLVPGELPFEPRIDSRLKVTLAIAWGWLAFASATFGVLLFTVMRLSDRRAAFVSAVTHELRTPLTTFQLYTDLLASAQADDVEKRQRYVGTLQKESHRLAHLVENVLAYSQMEQASLGLRISELELERVMEDVIPRLEQRCERSGATLKTTFADGSFYVRGEHAGFERVLVNLVDNACKYGEIDGRTASVEVSVCAQDDRVEIRVSDKGPGIVAAVRGRLFRPFSKSAHDAARSVPGVGLGLSLSRRIARTMHGDLQVESTGEDGSTFLFWLPRSP